MKTYFAVTIEDNKKYCAYVVPVSDFDNVISKLKISGLICANAYHTKKRASEVADSWNSAFKNDGVYLFAAGPAF